VSLLKTEEHMAEIFTSDNDMLTTGTRKY